MRSEFSPQGFLLDTTALIAFLRGEVKTTGLLKVLKEKAPLAACPITVAEVFSGTRDDELVKTNQFLSSLRLYPIDYDISCMAGRLRYLYAKKGITLSLFDTLIAAVAIKNSLVLVTANTRHYPMGELVTLMH